MDLCQDVLETGLVDLPANISADISIKYEIPNSMDIMNVNNDIDVLRMFDAYEDEGCRKIHIHVSFGLYDPQCTTSQPSQEQAIVGMTSLSKDPDFSDFGNDLLAGAAMNFSHDINAIKGKEVTNEMLLALASVPEDFDILAPMGVDFEYPEEELHISASDEEWQVGSEEEIDSDSEYEVDGSIVEKNSEGEDDGLSDYGSDEVHEDWPNSDVDIEQIHVDRAIQGRRFIAEEGSIRLENGMVFTNVNEFREALRDFAIQEGFELVRVKNDKARVTTNCACDGCPWRIHATVTPDEITFRIKTYVSQHTCIRTSKNSNATSTWIARKLRSKLYADLDLRYSSMQQDLLEKFGVQVSQRRLYRAKRKAREEDYGNHARSYKKIPAYANLVLETNPGSIAKIQYERPNIAMNPTLKRFFLCFDAMKKGFINGCRPFLGIDGCHLKGPFGGVLLAVISLDGNNGLFPVAIAIVEVECKDSWLFFLHHLDAALVSMIDKPLCIMSDQQKGLTDAVAQVFPGASHRLCCRHIYSNFKVKFPSLMLKINFWTAAKAYNEFLFNNAMHRIRVNNEAAYDWLMSKPKEMWARHAYDPRIKIDHVTNNMTESFNQWVGDLRAKPALTMLDGIRIKIMGRLNKRFEKANTLDSLVTPTIKKTLDLIQQDSRFCKVIAAGDDEYQVVNGFTTFVVNLIVKTCACGYWKISGLPCKHAAACIMHKRANVEIYCDEYLTSFTYLKAYGEIIHPLPNLNDINADEEVEPPILRRLPGRPRKNRRREPGEQPIGLNVARRSNTIKCQSCKRFGHNKRTCQRDSTVGSIRGTKETRTGESSGVGACANVMNNVVEDGLDATTQQSVNVASTGVNESTPLANDEPSGSDYAAF